MCKPWMLKTISKCFHIQKLYVRTFRNMFALSSNDAFGSDGSNERKRMARNDRYAELVLAVVIIPVQSFRL